MKDEFKTIRGGAWFFDGRDCRSAYRGTLPPDIRYSDCGFRLVASVTKQLRVLRGGSWLSFDENCRAADRNTPLPSGRSSRFGFRLAGREV